MNKVVKVIIKAGNYYMIIKTEGEKDYWVWQSQKGEFDRWSNSDVAVPTVEDLEKYANDPNNDTTGTSWSPFLTIKEAEESI